MDRCWILIGMMGAGKSSVGRILAQLSEREFLDTDLLLQQRLGRPIPQIFQVYGEDAFRDHEHHVLTSLVPGASVISTGGGIVLREDNWAEMRRLGKTVFLDASVPALIARLEASKKKRPMLQFDDWEDRVVRLLDARRPLYMNADYVFDVEDGDAEGIAAKLYEILVNL